MEKKLDPGINSGLYTACVTNDSSTRSYLRAGELAQAAGVSTDTLRHYERRGVLARPRRSANGYREYPAQALARVRLVRRALTIGFTLDELARILQARDRGDAPCREVRSLAAAKLSAVETQLRELVSMRDELRATLEDWDSRLAATTTDGERAALLETLAASPSSSNKTHRPVATRWRRSKKAERTISSEDQ